VTEAHVCEQLAQSRYLIMQRSGVNNQYYLIMDEMHNNTVQHHLHSKLQYMSELSVSSRNFIKNTRCIQLFGYPAASVLINSVSHEHSPHYQPTASCQSQLGWVSGSSPITGLLWQVFTDRKHFLSDWQTYERKEFI